MDRHRRRARSRGTRDRGHRPSVAVSSLQAGASRSPVVSCRHVDAPHDRGLSRHVCHTARGSRDVGTDAGEAAARRSLSRAPLAVACRRAPRIGRSIPRPQGVAASVRVVVSGLPKARARLARRYPRPAGSRLATNDRDHSRAASGSVPFVHAVETHGVADSGGLVESLCD